MDKNGRGVNYENGTCSRASSKYVARQVPDANADELVALFATGWQNLANAYRSGTRVAKMYGVKDVMIDKGTMRRVGDARKAVVLALFDCVSGDGELHMQAFGSEEVTSDYDVTIVGRGAGEAVWRMFREFARIYGILLPDACDTNLYANGTYMGPADLSVRDGRSVAVQHFAGRGGSFALISRGGVEYEDASMAWAAVKCLQGGMSPSGIGRVVDAPVARRAVTCLEAAQTVLAKARAVVASEDFPGMTTDSATDLVAMYALQCIFATRLEDRLFGRPASTSGGLPLLDRIERGIRATGCWLTRDDIDLVDLLSATMFFSVEAAYTQSTVNAVVLEMQAGLVSGLSAGEYRCAILENLGELLVHTRDLGDDDAVPLAHAIKVSKYFYRMAYCASKSLAPSDGAEAAELARRIQTEIVSWRGKPLDGSVGSPSQESMRCVAWEEEITAGEYRRRANDTCARLMGRKRMDGGGVPTLTAFASLLVIVAAVTVL